MPISAEVGSIFTIEDRASAVLAEIGEAAARLAASANEARDALMALGDAAPLAGLSEELAGVAASLASINASLVDTNANLAELGAAGAESGSAMGESFKFAAAEVDGVKASLAGLGEEIGAIGLAMGAGGAGRAAGGGLLGKLFSIPAMIAEYASFEAIKMGAKEDLFARIAVQNMGLPVNEENLDKYKNIAATASQGTIFGEAKTAELLSQMSGVLGFTGAGAMEKFQQIAPLALYMGELAKQQGLGNPEEAAVAGIQFAHMTGRYDPGELSKGLNELFSISQLTHTTPAQQLTVQKYAIPMARSLGMDPDEAMKLVGFFEQMGLKGSTAGTGFGQMMMGLLSIGGPLAAQQSEMTGKKFESILGLKQGTFAKGNMHVEALKELGLTNVFDDKGKIQSDVLINDLIEASKKFNPHDFAQLLQKAFTVRGGRNAAMLDDPEITSRLERFSEALKNLAPINQRQQELAAGAMQQFGQLGARLADLATTVGKIVDGPLAHFASALTALVDAFNHFLKWASGQESFSDSMKATSADGTKLKNTVKDVMTHPGNISSHLFGGAADIGFHLGQKIGNLFSPSPSSMTPVNASLMMRTGGFDAATAMRAASPMGLTVHGGINVYGAPTDGTDKWTNSFLSSVTKKLGNSQINNLGPGEGSYFSPFTTGGGQ